MGLSLGLPGFFVVFSTAGMVLGPILSLLGLVVGIPPSMLCERDRVLYAGLSISRVDLVFSLLIRVNSVYVHCLGSQMTVADVSKIHDCAECAGYLEFQNLRAESKRTSELLLDHCLVNNKEVFILCEEMNSMVIEHCLTRIQAQRRKNTSLCAKI